MNPTRAPSLFVLTLLAAGCGAAVTPAPAPSDGDAGAVSQDVLSTPVSTASCEEVRAACGPAPQQFVRGHARGLTGLDGARARFAMRYVLREGEGLNVAHGVVVAGPRCGAAPSRPACVHAAGRLGLPPDGLRWSCAGDERRDGPRGRRAMFSQRYATLGDEDVSFALNEVPSAPETEAALAALVDRTHELRVRGLDAMVEGGRAYAALVADERPVAAQVIGGLVEGGSLSLDWIMPGRQWPTERLALLIDRNGNRRCDDGDLGATVRLDGRRELDGVGPWVQGAALQDVCRALSLESGRER
nr:hypothetical protein [Deltaproteobacteria bacterium]